MSGKTTSKQVQAIKALLETPTIEEAAASIGVNPRTVYRWLNDQAFKTALSAAERDALNLAGRGLLRLAGDAVQALGELLANPDQDGATNRRLAAVAVLDQLVKLREIRTVEQRLADLEAAVYGDNKRKQAN